MKTLTIQTNKNLQIDLSIVVPLKDEVESLPELTQWIARVMDDNKYSYEIILIDDGSTDGSWNKIEELAEINRNIKGVRFRRNYGKSAALNIGFEHASGQVVITMDADLQDSPDEIPALRRRIIEEKFDIISGWKKKRYDPLTKTIPTKLFNWATRKMSGIYLHDFNCGLKAYRLEVVKNIEVYGEMHRYIPVIAKWQGFKKIGEQEVQHRARQYGVTKFGIERFVNGFLDLLSITFVGKFGKKPMHFFGLLGTLAFVLGFFTTSILIYNKLSNVYGHYGREIVDQPLFYISLTMIIIGVQLFITGFIAEMVARNSNDRNQYQISALKNL